MALTPENTLIAVLSLLVGGGVALLLQRYRLARRSSANEIASLRKQVERLNSKRDAADRFAVRRRQMDDLVRLQTMVAKDALDVLGRMSPEAVREVFREMAPHLFPSE